MSDSINAMRAADARSQQPYDGVLGTLPQWIPKNFHIEFESTRETLLQEGYVVTEIQQYMDEIVENERIALADPCAPPKMRGCTVMSRTVREAVYTLVMFQQAVRLAEEMGEEKGLAYLTDSRTAGLITKGVRFTGNSRDMSALYCEVLKILERFGKKTSADDVCTLLKEHGSEKVIQEVTEEDVYWSDDNGLDKTTQRTSFISRLGEIRKKVKTK